jgi:hypothetical protein
MPQRQDLTLQRGTASECGGKRSDQCQEDRGTRLPPIHSRDGSTVRSLWHLLKRIRADARVLFIKDKILLFTYESLPNQDRHILGSALELLHSSAESSGLVCAQSAAESSPIASRNPVRKIRSGNPSAHSVLCARASPSACSCPARVTTVPPQIASRPSASSRTDSPPKTLFQIAHEMLKFCSNSSVTRSGVIFGMGVRFLSRFGFAC